MFGMCIDEIAAAGEGELLYRGNRTAHGPAVIDSRRALPGSVFFAFSGEHTDGNRYLVSAMEAGAACVVTSEKPTAAVIAAAQQYSASVICCTEPDPGDFLYRLARCYRKRHLGWRVVGITGSAGKTTTKDMLICGLSDQCRVYGTQGNYNNLLGLPLTILSAPEDTEVLVLEMGMNAAGEIARLAACAGASLGAITNIGTSHMGLLGSREGIARAKAELVEALVSAGGLEPELVLSSGDDFTPLIKEQFADPRGIPVYRVGRKPDDCVSILDLHVNGEGCAHLSLRTPQGELNDVLVPIPGEGAIKALLMSLALVWRLGLSIAQASTAIARMSAPQGRLEVKHSVSGITVIDDCYNAAPASMAAALDVLQRMDCSGRRIAVLGEMNELGEHAEKLHAALGAYVAARQPDLLLCVGGDLAREMGETAVVMGMARERIICSADAGAALERLVGVLGAGDVVLVKASRSFELERVVRGVLTV